MSEPTQYFKPEGLEFEYDDDPTRPVLARSGVFVGVALPESGIQAAAILSPEKAIKLGRELERLGELVLAVRDAALDDDERRGER